MPWQTYQKININILQPVSKKTQSTIQVDLQQKRQVIEAFSSEGAEQRVFASDRFYSFDKMISPPFEKIYIVLHRGSSGVRE